MAEKTFAVAPGLRLKLHGNGRTGRWSVLVRVNGRKSRVGLGDWPGLTETKAKRLAAAARADGLRGVDRAAEKRAAVAAAAAAGTMNEQAAEYLATLTGKSADYQASSRWALTSIIAEMGAGNLSPAQVTEAMVHKALDSEPRPASRRTKHNTLRRMMTRLWKRRVISENPFDRIDPAPTVKSRSRFLTAPEVQAVWGGLSHLAQPHQDLFRLLICLPLRRREASLIEDTWVDLGEMVLRVPAEVTKSDRDFEIPLNHQAAAIFERNMRPGLLFPGHLSGNPIKNFSRASDKLRGAAGLPDIRLHDFRRTIVSALADAGTGFEVADALLNHAASASKGGITGVYQRADLKGPKARAMALWSELLDRAISTGSFEAEDNVVRIA